MLKLNSESWIVKVAYPQHPFALAERVWDKRYPVGDLPFRTSLCALSWRTAGMLVVHGTIGVIGVVGAPVVAGVVWTLDKLKSGFFHALYRIDERFGETIEAKGDVFTEKVTKTVNTVTAWELWKSLGTLKKKACPIVEIEDGR